ncbi:MAG TPA: LD-carboxypeptidase [Micromonosporaceae bacterium]|jgi:muramoyltetrapeptide carboxypeptidase
MLVSPSGPAPRDRIERGIEILSGWGLTVRIAPGALDRSGYLAGADETRLAGLNAALRDPAVRGVICTRGGYGAQRIVDGIDIDAVRADPKVLAGFSDITALQLALYRRAGLAGVHSPMAAWNAERTGDASIASMRAALMTTDPVVIAARDDEETAAVRIPGPPVEGTLLGGNLCLIAATIGTPDHPDLTGAILLLEDVSEPPYKIDRMLTHLRRTGVLSGLAGVAVGQFTDCADGWPTTLVDVLRDRLGDLGVPVLGGLPIGHGREQLSVPVGTRAVLDTSSGTLTAEAAVRG